MHPSRTRHTVAAIRCDNVVITGFFTGQENAHFPASTTWPAATVNTIDPVADERNFGIQQFCQSVLRPVAGRTRLQTSPSTGRPRCDISMTAAPASSAVRIVGSAAWMRTSLVIEPSIHRYIQILADKNAFARKIDILHRDDGHGGWLRRCERRLLYQASGSRSPTHCHTRKSL